MVSKSNKVISSMVLLALLLGPAFAYAQALQNPVPPVSGQIFNLARIVLIIQQVANFLIAVALIIAVIFILWGGIMYMSAGADEAKATEAKARIKNGIIGAAVVLAVGLIMSTLASIIATGTL